jgi:uncharacterized protein YktB (UPF0637 family)
MTFTGFIPTDFAAFQIDGLEARMEAIRERIQPKFRALGSKRTLGRERNVLAYCKAPPPESKCA